MQIQLVIGEQDKRYLNNLLNYLERNHMDQLEIFSFSTPELLKKYFANKHADIILLDEQFGVQPEELSGLGKVAILSQDSSVAKKNGIRVIVKFQKPDLIYKDILDLYAESGSTKGMRVHTAGAAAEVIMVTSFSGGTGASTIAAALARQYASVGKKTLYLNLDAAADTRLFFQGDGSHSFDEIVFSLKSRKADLRLKMESCVRTDKSGVYFFESCSNAMYMLELSLDDIIRAVNTLAECGAYEKVILDTQFHLSKDFVELTKYTDRILIVSDGSELANLKFTKTLQALHVMENQNQVDVIRKMMLLYNKFSSSISSSELEHPEMPVKGKIPPIKHALVNDIIGYVVGLQEIFHQIL